MPDLFDAVAKAVGPLPYPSDRVTGTLSRKRVSGQKSVPSGHRTVPSSARANAKYTLCNVLAVAVDPTRMRRLETMDLSVARRAVTARKDRGSHPPHKHPGYDAFQPAPEARRGRGGSRHFDDPLRAPLPPLFARGADRSPRRRRGTSGTGWTFRARGTHGPA